MICLQSVTYCTSMNQGGSLFKSNFTLLFVFVGLLFVVSCKEGADLSYTPPDRDNSGTPTRVEGEFAVENYRLDNKLTIDVYTPPEYDGDQLPILYFNDGDNFRSVFEYLTYEYPEPFIMVGIHAGSARNDRYIPYDDPWITQNWGGYTPSADVYSQQIIFDVIPFVEEKYAADTSRRAIFGISLGGLHATWIALKYPEYFEFVGAISPSYWVDNYAVIKESTKDLTRSNHFYFDIGTREWNYYVPFIGRLESASLNYGRHIFYYEVLGGFHQSADWARRIDIPLKLWLNDGPTGRNVVYDLQVECIASQVTPGLYFQRLNPTVTYDDGVTYSLTTEVQYEIIEGEGEVEEGVFRVDSPNGMRVKVSYSSWSEEVLLFNCI